MFADPQSITVNAVPQSLVRISSEANQSTYKKDDNAYTMRISRTFGSTRNRFTIRVDNQKLVADPLVVANNIRVSASCYFVMDLPILGYTNVEVKDIGLGLTGWASSGNLLKVLTGET